MKLLTYNILEGGTGRIDPLAEVIRLADADIVILQETWDEALFHKLADRLHVDRFLAENPKNSQGATGLLSRLPIHQATNHAVLDSRLTHSAFSAEITLPTGPSQLGTQRLSLIGLHLHAQETLADEALRLQEIAAILDIASHLPAPHLLAGDFNTSHPSQPIDLTKLRSKTKERIAGQNQQLPREVIRKLLANSYMDAHALHHSPAQFDSSYPTSNPALRVDFIFTTPILAPHIKSCEVFKPEIGRFASDHYPVLAEFQF